MILDNYIKRIGYNGELDVKLEVLNALQKCHLLAVPFENLDIHYGNRIELDAAKLYSKIVGNKRGGFCYEVNYLFQQLLDQIGFESKLISARVYDNKKGKYGPEHDHLAILVKVNQSEYLVDVGFGEFALYPLKLEFNKVQKDPRGDFIIEVESDRYIVSKLEGKTKTIEYQFLAKKRAIEEFYERCNYHQTSPNSHFAQKKMISRPIKNGRITLSGNSLKISENGQTIQQIEFPNQDYSKHLLKWFDIKE